MWGKYLQVGVRSILWVERTVCFFLKYLLYAQSPWGAQSCLAEQVHYKKGQSAPFGVRSAWVQMPSLPVLTDVDFNLLTYLTSLHLYHCTSKVESIHLP